MKDSDNTMYTSMIYSYDGFFPDEEDSEYFCKSILSIIENWEEATEGIRETWEENKRLINQKPDPDLKKKADEVNRELHVLPWATSAYLNSSVSLKNVLMPNADYWNITPRKSDRISKLLSEVNEKVIKYKQDQGNFKKELSIAINQAIALGSTAMYTYYDENVIEVREKVKEFITVPLKDEEGRPVLNEQGESINTFKINENGLIETATKVIKKDKVLYRGIKNKTIDLKYLAIWPIVGEIESSSKVYSYIEELDTLKALAEKGVYHKKTVDKLIKEVFETHISDINMSLEEFENFEINKTVAQGIRCRLCYLPIFKFPGNDKVFKRVFALIAEDKYVLKFQAYPYEYEPISFTALIPNITSNYGVHCIYGIGLIDPMKTSLSIGSALSSLNLDLTSYSLPIVKGHLDDDFKLEPGAEINTDPDQIEIIQNLYTNPYIFQSIGMYKAEGDTVSGMSSLSYPTVSEVVDPNIKATAMNLGKQISDAKLKDIASNLSTNLLVPVLKKNIDMTKYTYDAEEVKEILFNTEYIQNIQDQNTVVDNESHFLIKLIDSGKFFMDNYDIKVTGIESTFGKQEQILTAQMFLGLITSLGMNNIVSMERLANHIRKITDIPVEIELTEQEKLQNAELMQQEKLKQESIQAKQESMVMELQKMKMEFDLLIEQLKITAQMTRQEKEFAHKEKLEGQKYLAGQHQQRIS